MAMIQAHTQSAKLVTLKPKFTIQNYTCKYLDPKTHITAITLYSCQNRNIDMFHYKDIQYFTVPFYARSESNKSVYSTKPFVVPGENVLTTFFCPLHATMLSKQLSNLYKIDCRTENFSVKEMSYRASVLNIPLVVVLNSVTSMKNENIGSDSEEYDIFYTSRYLTDNEQGFDNRW